MIDTNLISNGVVSGSGAIALAYVIDVPMTFGATASDPQISLAFNAGTPFKSGANVIIPMQAVVTATYVNAQGVVYRQQQITEDFVAGYENAALPSAVASSAGASAQTLRKTKCCKSYELMIQGSVTVTVTA